ncbi:hypothetical protein [Sellimonas sp.]|uniref:hypothetical protein n=1 Tax=Sellimonas sp. TaxID=2021466 RepID=UPI00257FC634|nr:hypothetical protein [Sellimonas sp.]
MSELHIVCFMIRVIFILDLIFGIYFLTRPIQKEMEKELRKQCAIPLIIIGSFTMLWMTLTMKI